MHGQFRTTRGRGGAGADKSQIQIVDPGVGGRRRAIAFQGAQALWRCDRDIGQHIGFHGARPAPGLAPGDLAVKIFVHPHRDFDVAEGEAKIGFECRVVRRNRQIGPRGFMGCCRAGHDPEDEGRCQDGTDQGQPGHLRCPAHLTSARIEVGRVRLGTAMVCSFIQSSTGMASAG